jgi:hypothetical protein
MTLIVLVVAPLYSAGERPIEGVDAEWLCRGIKEHGHKEVYLCKDRDDIVKTLIGILKPGDVVMTLGAGDIHHVAGSLLEQLKSKQCSVFRVQHERQRCSVFSVQSSVKSGQEEKKAFWAEGRKQLDYQVAQGFLNLNTELNAEHSPAKSVKRRWMKKDEGC